MKLQFVYYALCAVLLLGIVGARLENASAQTIRREKPVAVGDIAPDFTLEDENGKSVTLSTAQGKTPVVLVFYRGYW